MLEVRDVNAQYETRYGAPNWTVRNVSFDLAPGRVLGIAGESGCGKSTLAAVLSSNAAPSLNIMSGTLKMEDKPLLDLSEHRGVPPDWRGTIVSLLPQRALNALNPTSRISSFVTDVVMEHANGVTKSQALDQAASRLMELGLPTDVLNAYPHQLSGGMRQRVVTVISTLLNPDLLIADEPTSALDVSSQKALILLLKQMMNEKLISRTIFISHDLALLSNIATHLAIMYQGEIVETGPVESVVRSPQHEYTQKLLNSLLEPTTEARERVLRTHRGITQEAAR